MDLAKLPADAASVQLEATHPVGLATTEYGVIQVPLSLDPGLDMSKTTYLSRMIQRWGTLPLMLLSGLDLKSHRYAFIGTEDWSMYPLLHPGSLVLVDETKRKIAKGGWASELERPIYFLEHRGGYTCGWCALEDSQLVVIPHPASEDNPQLFSYPSEIDLIGQITGVAMHLDQTKRRRIRS